MVFTHAVLRLSLAAGAAAVLLAMQGCAAPAATPQSVDPVNTCRAWMERLDAQTDAHAVRDGGATPVPGFGFLRVDRLLASFRGEAGQSEARWQAWGAALLALDAGARAQELSNLPPSALQALDVPDRDAAQIRLQDCGARLWQALSADPFQRARLRDVAVAPDDYSGLSRTLGFYPLSRLPFFAGVEREQRLWQARWETAAAQPAEPPGWMRYRVEAGLADAAGAMALARTVPRDALGIPRPDLATTQRLLQAHAPVLEIETQGGFDRPGRLGWAAGPAPTVDTAAPVVYQRLAHTRLGDQTLMQLVYSVWFTERPARSGLDLLAGRIDAVVLRLTLDADGRVLMLDSIHGCGCYHLFVPSAALQSRPPPAERIEWAFVPARLPALAPGQRLGVRIASGDHQVLGVAIGADNAAPATGYALADEDGLRSLPTPDGGRRSAFWSSGIMPGTERGERALFWPMGIESPGAMRQWGRHPTAFVGRRHFDDARLIEQRFGRTGGPARP